MNVIPPVMNLPVMSPRFAAKFDWENLPNPPQEKYGVPHTMATVEASLKKIAESPVLQEYVLKQPNSDDLRFYFTARDRAEWGEYNHCYELKVSAQVAPNRAHSVGLASWTARGLDNSEPIICTILHTFLELMKGRGLYPTMQPENRAIPPEEKQPVRNA